jgi:hypothetical protein
MLYRCSILPITSVGPTSFAGAREGTRSYLADAGDGLHHALARPYWSWLWLVACGVMAVTVLAGRALPRPGRIAVATAVVAGGAWYVVAVTTAAFVSPVVPVMLLGPLGAILVAIGTIAAPHGVGTVLPTTKVEA